MDQEKFENFLNEQLNKALLEHPESDVGEAFNSGVRTMFNRALCAMYQAIDYRQAEEDAE